MQQSWIRVPVSLIGHVQPSALIVYAVICDRGNMQPVQTTVQSIAAAAGVSDRTARRAIADLTDAGALTVQRTQYGVTLTPASLMQPTRQKPQQPQQQPRRTVRGARPMQQSSIDMRDVEALVNNFDSGADQEQLKLSDAYGMMEVSG